MKKNNQNVIYYLSIMVDNLKTGVQLTTTNKQQFEKNCRNSTKLYYFEKNLEMVKKHFGFIGKEVRKYTKSFSYVTYEEWSNMHQHDLILNPIEKEPVLFTVDHFNGFVEKYMEHSIKYHTKRLISGQIVYNSTDPFSNLENSWKLECYQQLITEYENILSIHKNETC